MMKKTLIAAGLAALFSVQAQADALGLYLGGHVWANEASGGFAETSQVVTFDFDDQNQSSYFVAFEHPLPFIPNAKIAVSDLATDGNSVLVTDFEFDDITFVGGSTVATLFDVSYVDYTLYYELFDNDLISFDFGLTARDISADLRVSSVVGGSTVTGKITADAYVPMVYAATNIGLPLTGLNVFAEGNFLSFDDHMLYDYQAGFAYELIDNLAIDVNVTLGYRSVRLELEDLDDVYSDIEFDGFFAGTVIHF